MPKTHDITLLVTLDKKIVSTPPCNLLPIKVGDTLAFSSPYGAFDITFKSPHVFATDAVAAKNPNIQVARAGDFAGDCRIELTTGEVIESGRDGSYGLDGQSTR